MKTIKTYLILASVVLLGSIVSAPAAEPTYWGYYTKDLVGTNLTYSAAGGQKAATTVTNIAQSPIEAWRYSDCWVQATGKADGTASGANITFVFIPVPLHGSRITSGTDAIALGKHINLFLGPSSNAVANVVYGEAYLPTSNACNYTLWMITNAGCNWTNLTLRSLGRSPVQ